MLAPDDSIEQVIQKVREAKSTQVDLLVPQGMRALQSANNCDKLRQVLERGGHAATLFTSDEKILKAARISRLETVAVDAEVMAGPAPSRPASGPEADFLASLEKVPEASLPPITNPRGLETIVVEKQTPFADDDDAWASALDSLSSVSIGGSAASSAASTDDWTAAFDGYGGAFGDEGASPEPPRKRIRPEDIELTADDLDRQGRGKKDAKKKKDSKKDKATSRKSTTKTKGAAGKSARGKGLAANPRLLIGGLVGVLALAAAIYFLFGRAGATVITVRPPAQTSGAKAYEDLRINYATTPITDPTSLAVQARLIETPVTVTVRGTVLTPTVQPDKAASGVVQIYNRNPQAYTLPANTRFISANPLGEEVSYLSTAEVVVPAASVSLAGSTNGIADVPVTASAGGERFNIPADLQGNWRIEGYEGALIAVNPEPIGGGTNALLKLPTQADILPLLNQAVPLFKNAVPMQLQAQLQPGESLTAEVDFSPSVETLVQDPSLYSTETRPVPGTDGDFDLLVTATFRGMAVQPNFAAQMQKAVRNALKLKDPSLDMERYDIVGQPQWRPAAGEANLLLVNVQVAPRSTNPQGLRPEVEDEIKRALAGLTPAAAQNKLAEFQQQGKIGGVVKMPEVELLPDDPTNIEIEVEVGQ